MSNALAERLSRMTPDTVLKLTKALDEMEKGGEQVVNPGTDIGTAGSSVRKAFGAAAFEPGSGNKQENFSYWQAWSDPSKNMDPNLRNAMLRKSLDEFRFHDTGHFKSMGHFVREGFHNHRSADFKAAHNGYFKDVDQNFFKARGITTVSGESGGFLLMPEFAPKVESIFFENDIPNRIDKMNIAGAVMNFPRAKDTNRADGTRHSGAVGYWVDTGSPITESNFRFGMTKLDMKKLCVVVFFPPELLSDTDYAIEDYTRKAIKEEINWQIARAIFYGADGPEPLGFMNTGALLSVPKESGQTNYTVNTANVVKMQSRLYQGPGSDPVWLAHKSTSPQLAQLEVGNMPVMLNINSGGITAPPQMLLRGMPIIQSEFCAQLGSVGDLIAADLKGYKGIMRSLVREDVSMHYEFLSDLSALRVIVGFDGRPLYNTPIQPFQAPGSDVPDTQSWFVTLAARKP